MRKYEYKLKKLKINKKILIILAKGDKIMMNIYSVGLEGEKKMINFEKITLSGFKNIDSININLDKITSILSINNYGKSNLLKGISFGFEFIEQNENIRNHMMNWKSGLPLNKNIECQKFKFEFEYLTIINKIKYAVNYGYEFKWSFNEKSNGKITNEWLNVKNTNESQKFSSYIKRSPKGAYFKSSTTAGCDKEIKIADNDLIINKLKAYDDLFYIDIINEINSTKIYIDRHFDSTENYDINPFVWKDKSQEENIARILFNIKKENINKYERLINTFKELFPSVEKIVVKCAVLGPEKLQLKNELDGTEPFELTDKIYCLFAKDKNLLQEIPFELMSDGAKRVLAILTHLVQADIEKYSLIAIEEPENSVHPRLLQNYLIALDSLLENAKLIITSHSPYLINYINPKYIYLGIPNDIGLAKFSKIKNSCTQKIMREASDMNMLIGEYLFDLMSGTNEDIELLTSFVE